MSLSTASFETIHTIASSTMSVQMLSSLAMLNHQWHAIVMPHIIHTIIDSNAKYLNGLDLDELVGLWGYAVRTYVVVDVMFSFQFWDRVKGMTNITTLVLGNMSTLWVSRQIQLPTVTRLFKENLVDKASFSRVGWTLYDTATLWEATNPGSEWCAGSWSLGDDRCWVQKLPKIDHTVVLDTEMWFNPQAHESLYANSWALAYHETGIVTNVFSLIKYQGDMSNFCITVPSFKDDWLMTWKDVNRKYRKDSTKLIATAGHEVLGAIRDQLNSFSRSLTIMSLSPKTGVLFLKEESVTKLPHGVEKR
ncbi:hypothetical protein C8J56DRAFT_888695 [Mycena floridula]|nr:hypothetical protein C8J56DRAFT_888695 [Mycena floridula]